MACCSLNHQLLEITFNSPPLEIRTAHFAKEYIAMFGEILVWKWDGEWLEADRHGHQEEDLSNR